MRFNFIIKNLSIYFDKPDIHKKTLKEVFNVFFQSLSKSEQEIFEKRLVNYNFQLHSFLDLQNTQISLNRFFKLQKKLRGFIN